MNNLYCLVYAGTAVLSSCDGTADAHSGILIPIPPVTGGSEETHIIRHLTEVLGVDSVILRPEHAELSNGLRLRLVKCASDSSVSFGNSFSWRELSADLPLNSQEFRAVQYLMEKTILSGENLIWPPDAKARFFNESIGRFSKKRLSQIESRGHIVCSDTCTTGKEQFAVIATALTLGILFDVFFNGQRFGMSVPIYCVLTLGGIAFLNRGLRISVFNLFLLSSTVLLCISYAIYNNAALRLLNGIAIPLALTLYVLSARYGIEGTLYPSALKLLLNKLIPQSLETSPKILGFSMSIISSKHDRRSHQVRNQILKGLLLSVPLLTVVILLLCQSDAVFNHMLSNQFHFMTLRPEKIIGHAIVTLLVTLYAFGYLWSLKYPQPWVCAPTKFSRNLSAVTALTVMGLLCAVYFSFTVIQFTYLYSPNAVLPQGLTYATYARKGFFELLTAAFINAGIILAAASKTTLGSNVLTRWVKLCNSAMTLFTLNLLVSAFYRMHLYESAYGFTELRLFVQFFMGFLFIALIALMAWIWNEGVPLFKTALTAAITVYLALNFVNVDRIVAQNNLLRYHLTQEIDIDHLSWLSVDAWPVIEKAEIPLALKKQLHDKFLMNRYPFKDEHDRWYEYNYNLAHFLAQQPQAPLNIREEHTYDF